MRNIVRQVAVLPSYNSMATVSLQIVCQVTVLPSFTGNLHCCKSGCSAPFLQQWGHSQLALLAACSNFIPIYPNLFEFILNLSEFYRVFEWKEGSCDKVAWSVLSQQPSSHIGLAYILDANAAYKDFADLFIVKLILGTCKGSVIIGFFIMTLIYYTRNEQTIWVG